MLNKREETKQSDHRIQMEALHQKHIALAKVAEGNGDQVLAEGHYQNAEYYLHLMNELSDGLPITSVQWIEKSPRQNTKAPISFGKSFLRRKQRGVQRKSHLKA